MLSCCWFAIITPKTLASVSCRGAPPPALNQQGLRTWTRRFHPQPIGPVPGAACDQRKLRLLNPPKNLSIPLTKITSNAQQLAAPSCAAQAHLRGRDLELLRARDAVCGQVADARVSLAKKPGGAALCTYAGKQQRPWRAAVPSLCNVPASDRQLYPPIHSRRDFSFPIPWSRSGSCHILGRIYSETNRKRFVLRRRLERPPFLRLGSFFLVCLDLAVNATSHFVTGTVGSSAYNPIRL